MHLSKLASHLWLSILDVDFAVSNFRFTLVESLESLLDAGLTIYVMGLIHCQV